MEGELAALARAGVLTHYFEVARDVGLDPAPLLREAGLTRAMLSDPDSNIPLGAAMKLIERSAERSGCGSFGLRMGERRQPADMGPVGLLLQHQATLRDAIQVIQRYEHLINESLSVLAIEEDDLVVIREELAPASGGAAPQSHELAVGVLFRFFGEILGPQWRPLEIRFVHSEPAETAIHRRLFRCPVLFGAEFNGLVIARADFDRRNPQADAQMARYARRFLDAMPDSRGAGIEQHVRNALYILLPAGRGSLRCVADHLGLNVRTLQRRMEDANLTFADILDDVRAELALRHLQNGGYPLNEIADLLGYSSHSAFSRWFGRRFHMSPRAHRLQNSAGRGS